MSIIYVRKKSNHFTFRVENISKLSSEPKTNSMKKLLLVLLCGFVLFPLVAQDAVEEETSDKKEEKVKTG